MNCFEKPIGTALFRSWNSSVRNCFQQRIFLMLILALICLAIGIYHIATTVVIPRDGVFYIGMAKDFPALPDDGKVFRPMGLPALISICHKITKVFLEEDRCAWILSGQIVSLIFRMIAIVPFYLICEKLAGKRNVFWAVLLFLLLPDPAKYGASVLREWPFLCLFLIGIYIVICIVERPKFWHYITLPVVIALACAFRTEAVQLAVFAAIACLVGGYGKPKTRVIYTLLLLALIVLASAIYIYISKPDLHIFDVFVDLLSGKRQLREPLFYGIYNGSLEFCEEVFQSLKFFAVPAIVGLVYMFRKWKFSLRILIASILLVNCLMPITYYLIPKTVSGRYCIAFVSILSLFAFKGISIMAVRISLFAKRSVSYKLATGRIFFLCVGLAFVVPSLFKPIGDGKRAYLEAAQWLNNNTTAQAQVCAFDKRIPFYADRKMYPSDPKSKWYISKAGELPKKYQKSGYQLVETITADGRSLGIYKEK